MSRDVEGKEIKYQISLTAQSVKNSTVIDINYKGSPTMTEKVMRITIKILRS